MTRPDSAPIPVAETPDTPEVEMVGWVAWFFGWAAWFFMDPWIRVYVLIPAGVVAYVTLGAVAIAVLPLSVLNIIGLLVLVGTVIAGVWACVDPAPGVSVLALLWAPVITHHIASTGNWEFWVGLALAGACIRSALAAGGPARAFMVCWTGLLAIIVVCADQNLLTPFHFAWFWPLALAAPLILTVAWIILTNRPEGPVPVSGHFRAGRWVAGHSRRMPGDG